MCFIKCSRSSDQRFIGAFAFKYVYIPCHSAQHLIQIPMASCTPLKLWESVPFQFPYPVISQTFTLTNLSDIWARTLCNVSIFQLCTITLHWKMPQNQKALFLLDQGKLLPAELLQRILVQKVQQWALTLTITILCTLCSTLNNTVHTISWSFMWTII